MPSPDSRTTPCGIPYRRAGRPFTCWTMVVKFYSTWSDLDNTDNINIVCATNCNDMTSQCDLQGMAGANCPDCRRSPFPWWRVHDLLARVNVHLSFAGFTFDVTAPVELTMAPLTDGSFVRVITAATAHQIATVHTLGIAVTEATPCA